MPADRPFTIRRIVAGENARGRSVILADSLIPVVNGTPDYLQIAELWRTDADAPAIPALSDSVDPAVADIQPPIGGTRFVIEIAHPESEGGRDEASVRRMFEAISAGGARTEASADQHPGMHKTDTIDYIMVLKGEIHFIVEEQEILIRQGDILVDTGVNHSWANRSGQPCVLAAVMIGADRAVR